MASKFTQTQHGNEILVGPDKAFFVSYRASCTNAEMGSFGMVLSMFKDFLPEEKGAETALVTPNDGQIPGRPRFRILRGDFRREYEGLISQGLDACIE